MEEKILEFIHRRFSKDCDWMNGNCYFFAQILASRFMGEIVYDPIEGHFLFYAYDENFYDWSGRRDYTDEYKANFVLWESYSLQDSFHRSRIWRDCVK